MGLGLYVIVGFFVVLLLLECCPRKPRKGCPKDEDLWHICGQLNARYNGNNKGIEHDFYYDRVLKAFVCRNTHTVHKL